MKKTQADLRHEARKKRIATLPTYNHLGYYYDPKKERVVYVPRPKISKFYKRLTHRAARRTEHLLTRNEHKKLVDYWWSIY